jgi:hypothetical protein
VRKRCGVLPMIPGQCRRCGHGVPCRRCAFDRSYRPRSVGPGAGWVAQAARGARPGQDRPRSCRHPRPGWDCLADVALLRSAPGVFGRVASDPTFSRTIDALAAKFEAALAGSNAARAAARARAWKLAGAHVPDRDVEAAHPLVIDVDATLVTAHSEKEQVARIFNR